MKNMMRVAAVCVLFGATHAQIPLCKLTGDCRCIPQVTIDRNNFPDCFETITLLAPTNADNGCCENTANINCTNDFGCAYDLCATVTMKTTPTLCQDHNWSWDDGQGGTCTDRTGTGQACTGQNYPACGVDSNKQLYIYDTWGCDSQKLVWWATWTCGDNDECP